MDCTISIYWKETGYPLFHGSIDQKEWATAPMLRDEHGLFSINLQFTEDIKFVICNEEKTHWYHPHKQLSNPSTFFKDNENCNFLVTKFGKYVIINSIMTEILRTTEISNEIEKETKGEQLIVINIDGILVGDELSLLHFNMLWISRFYTAERLKLVYTTGRSLEDVLKLQSIILPQYLICEGGSYIYKYKIQKENSYRYELIYRKIIEEEDLSVLQQLTTFGFYKANLSRGNSYVVPKHILIQKNSTIMSFLESLNFQYQMVEETEVVFFDFLPKGVNKHSALQIVVSYFKQPKVIAFGSNLSDYQVMYHANKCILPINAQHRLAQLLEGKAIKAQGQFAEALIEYFEVQGCIK